MAMFLASMAIKSLHGDWCYRGGAKVPQTGTLGLERGERLFQPQGPSTPDPLKATCVALKLELVGRQVCSCQAGGN